MLAPEVETRPWAEQLAVDDQSYRDAARLSLRALGLLPREARRRRGSPSAEAAGGLAEIAGCRSPTSRSCGRPARPRPVRRPPLRGAGRDRPDLLDQRHDRHPQLHPADRGRPRELGHRLGAQLRGLGRRAGQRIVTTYNAGPFAAGAALAAFDRIGLTHIPVGTGNTERLVRAIELLAPEAAVLRPPTPPSRRMGGRARLRPPRLERRARPRRGRARRRRARLPRAARGGLGRARDRGDGDRRHRRLAVGRVRGAGRHAPRRARLRPRRS